MLTTNVKGKTYKAEEAPNKAEEVCARVEQTSFGTPIPSCFNVSSNSDDRDLEKK